MIPLTVPEIRGNEWKYIKECLDTKWVSSVGKYVETFEERFAEYIESRYAIAVVNGTSAIHTALMSTGITNNDEVIVPTLTFVGTVNPIRYCGARPIFIDSESNTWNISSEKIIKFIEKNTIYDESTGKLINRSSKNQIKAILPVHLYGYPTDMDHILEIARRYNLIVIEDATEALGSKYKGINVGKLGDIGCFSFNGNKLITTGSGGMIVTDNEQYAKKAKYLTTQARDDEKEYIHNEIGYNYRLSNLQSAIGVAQLEMIDEFIEIKRRNAMYYTELLKDVKGISTCIETPAVFNCFWMYSILVKKDEYCLSKNDLLRILENHQIQARSFFKPIHTLLPYQKFYSENIVVANELYEQGINLPSSVGIKKEEIERVVDVIKKGRELYKMQNIT